MQRASALVSFLFIFARGVTLGQAPAKLEFEVASVRGGRALYGKDTPTRLPLAGTITGGPGTSDPERITYTRVVMMTILRNAFELNMDQFSGPSWFSDNDPYSESRYDIAAKLPPGTTKEQLQIMLQNLLKERLGLKFHYEKKDFDVYALVVAKNGPKLKPAQEAGARPTEVEPGGIKTFETPSAQDYDGFPQLPAGVPAIKGVGKDESMKMTARMQTMESLAKHVGVLFQNPRIVDKTGLTGKYDFRLEFSNQMAPQAALPIALEQQLGLRLEKSKAALDVLVIDHIDKLPTEN